MAARAGRVLGALIVGLDLATTTGVAVIDDRGVRAGALRLSKPSETAAEAVRLRDVRYPRLATAVAQLIADHPGPVVVAWEEVQFASTLFQYRTWVTLRDAVWLACETAVRPVMRCAVPVGQLKQFATGSGAADKAAMARAAVRAGYDVAALDDNGVDALWVAVWAEKFYAEHC